MAVLGDLYTRVLRFQSVPSLCDDKGGYFDREYSALPAHRESAIRHSVVKISPSNEPAAARNKSQIPGITSRLKGGGGGRAAYRRCQCKEDVILQRGRAPQAAAQRVDSSARSGPPLMRALRTQVGVWGGEGGRNIGRV